MRTASGKLYRTALLLLFSLFLSQRASSTVEKTNLNLPLGSEDNNPPDKPLSRATENHNASGHLDSCLSSQQEEEAEGEMKQLSVEMEDAATTAPKAGADVDTAPASVARLDDKEEGSGRSSSLGEGEGYIPERYIVGCGGDRVEAARRWKETVRWREENKVDEILETPQPRFHDCRQVFPVYLHGRSRQGMPVLWERIGKVNVAKADELKLHLPELTPNYVFLNECVWKLILDKGEDVNDDAKFITVEDVGGVRLWHLTPKVLSVLRALTGTMKAHYVERCHKSYIINAPRAFTALWRVVSAMLDARTRAKISILGTDFLGAMQEEIDVSQIPPEYGGSSGRAIDDSDDERKIQALVARLNLAAETAGTTVSQSS